MAYVDPMPPRFITVVESRDFQQRAIKCMSNREREAFISFIAQYPEAGDIMVGTGGVRKVRWGIGARGKSGGVRIIYYYHSTRFPLFLITVFAKNEKADLSQKDKNTIKQLTSVLIETYERIPYEQSGRTHYRRT